MKFTAEQLASLLQGKVEGDPQAAVESFGKIEEARPGQLSFLANLKYEEHLYSTQASIVLVSDQLPLKKPVVATLIRVTDPYKAFATLLTYYQNLKTAKKAVREEPVFISNSSSIGKDVYLGAFVYVGEHVRIGNNVKLYPNVYLGDHVVVGDDTVLHPGVIVYHDCVIGRQVTIHAGTVIGSDGFGFAPDPTGHFQKIPQIGNVVIGDQVEIGANTTIDRATIGSTYIHAGVKLDNLIQVAHNVEIGESTVIAAQTGISGSTRIGKQVMIGGQAGLAGHIQIADGTKINGQSGITKTIQSPNTSVSGTPAYDYRNYMRAQSLVRQLPEMEKRIRELESQLKTQNSQNSGTS
jgi:UDP-3-O-[3-hydroxymyristoyl] glucosamine N-acyltransferase